MKGCDIAVASLVLVLIQKFDYNIMAMVIVFKWFCCKDILND